MLTDKDPATGEYRIPRIIYSDAYYSETVAYADLVLPDTTYLERWDCISLLDRPIGGADGPGDAIRQPILAARPRRAPVPGRADRNRRPARAAGLCRRRRARRAIPAATRITSSLHERTPGVGPLAGWRGEDGESAGQGRAEPAAARPLHREWLLLEIRTAAGAALLQARQQGLSRNRDRDGADRRARADRAAALCRDAAALPPRGAGPRHRACRRKRTASGSRPISTRCRSGIRRSRKRGSTAAGFPLHAITQRPMQMYHSWHSQNAWLRQILGQNRLFINRATARALGLDDDDWVWVSSHPGRIEAQIKLMDGVNPDTVWTWNAIGKRSGAWNLAPDSPEFTQGFLLNHLISDLLPPPSDGAADGLANADPITGQAAWYDLRVRIERAPAAEAGHSAPRSRRCTARPRCRTRRRSCAMAAVRRPRGRRCAAGGPRSGGHDRPAAPASGPEKARSRHRPRYLRRLPRLRDRVQGMEHRRPHGAAARFQRLWRRRLGRVVQPHPFVRGRGPDGQGRARAPSISRNPACIARSRPASRCARPAPPTSAPRTASCWSTRASASAASCAPGPAPTARASSTPTKAS